MSYRIFTQLLLSFLLSTPVTLTAQALAKVDSLIKERNFTASIKICNAYIYAAAARPDLELGNMYMRKGRSFFGLDKLDSSLVSYFAALKIFEAIDNPRRASAATSNIGDIYHRKGEYGRSMKYYEDAHQFYLILNDSSLLEKNSNDRAVVLYKLGKTSAAIALQEQAIQSFTPVMNDAMHTKHLMNLGTFFETLNADSAFYYYHLAEPYAVRNNDSSLLATLYNNIGTIHKNQGQWPAAADYLQRSADLAGVFENNESAIKIYHNLADVYDTLGLHLKANFYLKKVIDLTESVFNETSEQFSSELAERYESGKKDEQIKFQATENKLKTRNLVLSLFGLCFASLFALFVYLNYRRKKRDNEALQLRNTHIEMLNKDLDEANQVKTKLYAVISHDIRAPLSTLEHYLALNKQGVPDQNAHAIRQIDHVLDTLEDLLIWGKSQLHGFKPTYTVTDIPQIIHEQITGVFFTTIALKKLQPDLEFQGGLSINTDANLLSIILRNILSNAFKFAPSGSSVKINATQHAGNIEVTVSNLTDQSLPAKKMDQSTQLTSSSSGLGYLLIQDFSNKIHAHFAYHHGEDQTTATLILPTS
ncbi:MAG: tetratricopeptide repeat protein [Agriterribacter sp.]